MSDDPLARLRAEMDQAREGLKEVAGNLRVFYDENVAQGFTDEQAFRLTRDFLIRTLYRPAGDAE